MCDSKGCEKSIEDKAGYLNKLFKKIFVKILGSLKKFSYLYNVESEVSMLVWRSPALRGPKR